jgi:hypothetical protein
MFTVLSIFAQAALPPPGLHYNARSEYAGPGLVCGAAFSILLDKGERAVLTKRSFIDSEMSFRIRDGQFAVHESQYATEGGKLVKRIGDGILMRKRVDSRYIWIFRDDAPGSTDVYGPAVNTSKPSSALNRIKFSSPKSGFVGAEKCLSGKGSEPRAS